MNSGVENETSLCGRESRDGIQVQFGDFRYLFHQPGDSQQQVFNRIQVCSRMAAITLEQPESADFPDQGSRVFIGKRSHPEAHVAENLDVNPSETERERSPPQRREPPRPERR